MYLLKEKVSIFSGLLLFLIMFLASTAFAMGDNASVVTSSSFFSPVDADAIIENMANGYKKSYENENLGVAEDKSNKIAYDMMQGIGISDFLLTRVVLFGLTGFDDASEFFATQANAVILQNRENQERNKEVVISSTGAEKEDAVSGRSAKHNTNPNDRSKNGKYNIRTNDLEEKVDRHEQLSQTQENVLIAKYQAASEGLKKAAAAIASDSNGSGYDKMAKIAYLISVIVLLIRLAFISKDIISGNMTDAGKVNAMMVLIEFVFTIFFIKFFKYFIGFIAVLGLTIRDMIMGGDFDTMSEALRDASAFRAMVTAGADGITGGSSLLDFDLKKVVTNIIVCLFYNITSGVCYVFLVIGDLMMALTAMIVPVLVALSGLPIFSSWKRYIIPQSILTVAAYMPIMGIMMYIISAAQSFLGYGTFASFIMMSLIVIYSVIKLPMLAHDLNAARVGANAITAWINFVKKSALVAVVAAIAVATGGGAVAVGQAAKAASNFADKTAFKE